MSKLWATLKGYKTILFAFGLIIFAILQDTQLSELVGGCIFKVNATQPDSCVIPAGWCAAIGIIVFMLRIFTTSNIFNKSATTATDTTLKPVEPGDKQKSE